MKSSELRQKYLEFFASKGHAVIPSASLIPENDPTCLFTTAGMHPLVPFLLGEKHPAGSKLTSCQKCVRTGDIDSVGDAVHLTFFEMLGNWSFGDLPSEASAEGGYWKREAIEMSFEFLTEILGFPLEKLAVSVFAGDEDVEFDSESFEIWKSLGIPENRIAKLSKKDNWWGPAGQTGPCGPDTEMFFWNADEPPPEKFDSADSRWVEIWNDVFMEFEKKVKSGKSKVESEDGGEFEFVPLKQKNVDTGMGLDRVAAILQKVPTVFETDLFVPIISKIRELAKISRQARKEDVERSERIIADHLRAATFIIGDPCGVPPSNVDAGYVVRRLIRRAIREARKLDFDFSQTFTPAIAEVVIEIFGETYPELVQNSAKILLELEKEENQFKKTLNKGEREFWRTRNQKCVDGKSFREIEEKEKTAKQNMTGVKGLEAFYLFETYGFPKELTLEIAQEFDFPISENFEKEFDKAAKTHADQSRTASAGKFAGGLADDSEAVAQLHTATHLLNAALRKVLGDHVFQKGSNITAERLRFDFSHSEKLTPEQKAEVEKIVNEAIQKNLPIKCEEMTVDEAKAAGAVGVFDSKYGEKVKVFSIGDFSREICGGPHAKNTGELGKFKIKKEESSSAGVRRIKAVLLSGE
ncbi:alanine--tRNA ligase [Patescibacteria group bacterium]|nr:alanine--tRNA ligase [Patescibacteria group bacterium]